jgi:tRNA pseudouridine38-40 synthase
MELTAQYSARRTTKGDGLVQACQCVATSRLACLKSPTARPSFDPMASRTLQLVIQYDGGAFAGWQRQPDQRTVQGVIEEGLAKLMRLHVPAFGAGRTDAGVHAIGQSVSVIVPEKWTAELLQRALNAVLPRDVRCARAVEMDGEFHARFSAKERQYRYLVGTDAEAAGPFRYNREWALITRKPDLALLRAEAADVLGDHCFRSFAVKGTAPETDSHHCIVRVCRWDERVGGLMLTVAANRFLHHMVRFLVGTMVEVGTGRRAPGAIRSLLATHDNQLTAAPAPACGLYLEHVEYPAHLYLATPPAVVA